MNQLSLFDAPHNGTPTSIAAAVAQSPAKAETDRTRIMSFVLTNGGSTRDEIAVGLNMLTQTVCPRVNELVKRGLLIETTEKRKTRTGAGAVVLECSK